MYRAFRHIVLLLVAVALIGGTTSEVAFSAQAGSGMVMAGMPCDMAMPATVSGDVMPMPSCKGMTPDCIKLMGCVTISALPAQYLAHGSTVQYGAIRYRHSEATLVGLDHEPEPLPPRTA